MAIAVRTDISKHEVTAAIREIVDAFNAFVAGSPTGALQFKGTWNATTNTPALASGVGGAGNLYRVSVAGSTTLDGLSSWNVGDEVWFDGTAWNKIDGLPTEVLSVAGRTGAVTLGVADVSGAAPLASPALSGTPTAPTAAVDTNTTQLATAAFVLAQAAAATPLVEGAGAVGTSTRYARADHVHPAGALSTDSDVTLTSPAAGQPLVYDGSKWRNGNKIDIPTASITASSSTLALDRANGEVQRITLSANVTTVTIANWATSGQLGRLVLIITSTGAFTISGWPAGTIWAGGSAPTMTSGSGKKDIYVLMSPDAGTTIFGSIAGQNYS